MGALPTTTMPIYPHYNVWLHCEGEFALPPECYVACRFHLRGNPARWTLETLEFGSLQQCIFRHMQNVKYYDKIRTVPCCLILKLSETTNATDYAYNGTPPTIKVWHSTINWHSVLSVLLAECRTEFPCKLAGYDGPQTPG